MRVAAASLSYRATIASLLVCLCAGCGSICVYDQTETSSNIAGLGPETGLVSPSQSGACAELICNRGWQTDQFAFNVDTALILIEMRRPSGLGLLWPNQHCKMATGASLRAWMVRQRDDRHFLDADDLAAVVQGNNGAPPAWPMLGTVEVRWEGDKLMLAGLYLETIDKVPPDQIEVDRRIYLMTEEMRFLAPKVDETPLAKQRYSRLSNEILRLNGIRADPRPVDRAYVHETLIGHRVPVYPEPL
jgi:hypothetical protein